MKVKTLASSNPELLGQWHPTKNGKLQPDKVAAGSKRVIWWKCRHGHEWQASIADRHRGSLCPRCTPTLTSVPERWLFVQIRSVFPDAVNAAQLVTRHRQVEYDIYVPSISFAIEYDGLHHASKRVKDEEKNLMAQQADITLVRVRTTGLPDIRLYGAQTTCHNPKSPESIHECLAFIGNVMVEVADLTHEQQMAIAAWGHPVLDAPESAVVPMAECLAEVHPKLAVEWDESANLPLTPSTVGIHSRRQVWWCCSQGHRFKAAVRYRVRGATCPYCAGQFVTEEDSIASVVPHLTPRWHVARNGKRTPYNTPPNSPYQAWWTCPQGHIWKQSVRKLVSASAFLCPHCACSAETQ